MAVIILEVKAVIQLQHLLIIQIQHCIFMLEEWDNKEILVLLIMFQEDLMVVELLDMQEAGDQGITTHMVVVVVELRTLH